MAVKVNVESNTDEVLSALEEKVRLALDLMGEAAAGDARENCPVDTGRLRNSVTHETREGEKAVYIGTNVEYAPYIEFGTGIYAESGGGRQTPWFYVDEKGRGHWTRGIKPTHFLRNALQDNARKYEDIAQDVLKNG